MEKKSFFNQNAISIMAAIVSICALFVSFYQTKIMREQQYASVKPLIIVGNSMDTNLDSTGRTELLIWNKGIGPALIKYVNFRYKEHNYAEFEFQKIANMMIGRPIETPLAMVTSSASFSPIGATDQITMFKITNPKYCYLFNYAYFDALKSGEFDVIVYFTDIYDRLYKTSLRKNKTVTATKEEMQATMPKELKEYME